MYVQRPSVRLGLSRRFTLGAWTFFASRSGFQLQPPSAYSAHARTSVLPRVRASRHFGIAREGCSAEGASRRTSLRANPSLVVHATDGAPFPTNDAAAPADRHCAGAFACGRRGAYSCTDTLHCSLLMARSAPLPIEIACRAKYARRRRHPQRARWRPRDRG